MGVGLPYTLQGCGSLTDGEMYEIAQFNRSFLDDNIYPYCYPVRATTAGAESSQLYEYYVHTSCVVLSDNETALQHAFELLYGTAQPFTAAKVIGFVFGALCAVMAVVNLAGVVRLAINWEQQRILSITDLFGHSAIGPCFLAAAMYAFMSAQYFNLYTSTLTVTFTLEVLVVLTAVVIANVLVISVAGLLRSMHTIYSKISNKPKEERKGTIDRIVHYTKSVNLMWFWLVVIGIFPLTVANLNSLDDTIQAFLGQLARLYYDIVFIGFAAELMILAVSLRRVYIKLKRGYLQNGFTREVQRLERDFQWWIFWVSLLSVVITVASIIAITFNVMTMLCTFTEEDIFGNDDAEPVDTNPKFFIYFAYVMHALRFIYIFQVTYIFLHVALFKTEDKFSAVQVVPRDILSILRSTDVPPMQLEVRRTPSTIKRSNSAVLAREKEFERACQDEERLVLQMPHFVGLSASSQNILMTTHRVPATEMTCEYKRGELIFPNATTEADAPDNSVIVGIVLSGYVELTFDAWLDEEEQEALRQAQANTASSMSVFAAAAAAASATSAAPRRTKPRPRPGVKEFGGMIFEPYSYIYNRRIAVPVEHSHYSLPADAVCIFRAKTACKLLFLRGRLQPLSSPFGAGVAAAMRQQQRQQLAGDMHSGAEGDNDATGTNLKFDLSEGNRGTLFVAPLDPHLFDSDRCSLARFSFGLRDNPSFSLDGLASIIFEQLNREIPIDGRSTASVTGVLNMEFTSSHPFQHFTQQLLPPENVLLTAAASAAAAVGGLDVGEPAGNAFHICAWLRTAATCLSSKPVMSRPIGRYDTGNAETLFLGHRVCDIPLGSVVVLALIGRKGSIGELPLRRKKSMGGDEDEEEFDFGDDDDDDDDDDAERRPEWHSSFKGDRSDGDRRQQNRQGSKQTQKLIHAQPPVLAFGCVNVFNSDGQLRVGQRCLSTMDLTDASSLGGVPAGEYFEVVDGEWVPKKVFTGANLQLRSGEQNAIEFSYAFQVDDSGRVGRARGHSNSSIASGNGGASSTSSASSHSSLHIEGGEGVTGVPLVCADLKMPGDLENPIQQLVRDLGNAQFRTAAGGFKGPANVTDDFDTDFDVEAGGGAGRSATDVAPKLKSNSSWHVARANLGRINAQRQGFKSVKSIAETLQKHQTAMQLLASSSVQGSVFSNHSERHSDRAMTNVRRHLGAGSEGPHDPASDASSEKTGVTSKLANGIQQVMTLMEKHAAQVIRDRPDLLPAILENVADVDWWRRDVGDGPQPGSVSGGDSSGATRHGLEQQVVEIEMHERAGADLSYLESPTHGRGGRGASSKGQHTPTTDVTKRAMMISSKKGINDVVELMCQYDILSTLKKLDGEKCLTQALKLLGPLTSHPFARGIGVAYLLLLETRDLHGLICSKQESQSHSNSRSSWGARNGHEMDVSLGNFVLQFVQALKFETHIDNPLSRFLIYLADVNAQVRKDLLWSLHAEVESGSSNLVLHSLRDLMLQQLDEIDLWRFHEQLALTRKLTNIHKVLMDKDQREAIKERGGRNAVLRQMLGEQQWPSSFELGFRLSEFAGLNAPKCKAMSSKQVPLWLSLKEYSSSVPRGVPPPTTTLLFKRGDDLRQDQLTVQFLRCLNRIWAAEGLDLHMTTYDVVAMGNKTGIIEVVENCSTVANIMRDDTTNAQNSSFQARIDVRQAFDAAFSHTSQLSMLKWLVRKRLESYHDDRVDILAATLEYDDGRQLHKILESPRHAFVLENFKKSCAAFCVASNILGIGDRHPSNLMLRDDGNYLHIDFGHFLGNFKKKFGIKRETAPFVFTHQFAAVLGGSKRNSDGTYVSKHYQDFVDLCKKAFVAVRRHSSLLISLFNLMVASGIDQISNFEDVQWLRDRLLPGYGEKEAADYFEDLIAEALKSLRTQVNYFMHLIRHG